MVPLDLYFIDLRQNKSFYFSGLKSIKKPESEAPCVVFGGQFYYPQKIQIKELPKKHSILPRCKSVQHVPTQERFQMLHEKALEDIQNQTLEKIVLYRKTMIEYDGILNPEAIFSYLMQANTGFYGFYATSQAGEVFLGCSPERLYEKKQDTIYVDCLAGTRPKNSPPDELLESIKDQKEHNCVLDSILQTLISLGLEVKAGTQRLMHLSHVMHLHTPIQAFGLVDEYELIEKLNPTPAILGHPKSRAGEWTQAHMPWVASPFRMPVGYINCEGISQVAVAIRSGLVNASRIELLTGVGVVEGSQADWEWSELEHKIKPWINM